MATPRRLLTNPAFSEVFQTADARGLTDDWQGVSLEPADRPAGPVDGSGAAAGPGGLPAGQGTQGAGATGHRAGKGRFRRLVAPLLSGSTGPSQRERAIRACWGDQVLVSNVHQPAR